MRDLTEQDTDLGTLVDLDEFLGDAIQGNIDDHDGYGYLVYDEDQVDDKKEKSPSDIVSDNLSEDVTHVLWFAV